MMDKKIQWQNAREYSWRFKKYKYNFYINTENCENLSFV